MQIPEDLDKDSIDCYWYVGAPGTGKTYASRHDFEGEIYYKNANKWWCGYRDQPVVVIDDFSLSHACLGYHLKIWAQEYAFIAEIKCGAMCIRPKTIVVTSNYTIEEIFKEDKELREAIKRRFKVVRFTDLGVRSSQ